ncbi:MAG: hypothetical protein ACREFP_26535 [Acetobacteraceae bacterium]
MNVLARSLTIMLPLLALAACESTQPATHVGEALDRAGSTTAHAIGHAAVATGNALDRAGKYMNDKLNPDQAPPSSPPVQ